MAIDGSQRVNITLPCRVIRRHVPFPSSLIIGTVAQAIGTDEPTLDDDKIEEARW